MPDLISRIPIGFNLDGYDFLNSSEASAGPTAFSSGGIDANWEGGLVDNQWVADTSLKQVQVQVTNYQSAPLQYEADGQKYYGEARDGQDNYSDSGEARFIGTGGIGVIGAQLHPADINNCQSGKLSPKLQSWSESISRAESGRKDFFCGVAIATKAVADYLNHFYSLGTDGVKVTALAEKKILCVEMLFNTTGTQGKAYRFKVVDCLSSNNSTGGTKGTYNHGQYCEYDVIDIMTPILLLNDFSDLASLHSDVLNETVNQGLLTFPWANAGYNYKKAQIPGYGPIGIANLGLVYESKAGTIFPGQIYFKSKARTNSAEKHCVARARYFVDPENKEVAKSVIPNLPDDFFQTNYSDKATPVIYSGASYTGATTTPGYDNYLQKPIKTSVLSYIASPPTHLGLPTRDYFKYNHSSMVLVDLPGPIINTHPTRSFGGLKAPGNKKVYCHKNMADRLEAVLKDTVNHYGDQMSSLVPILCSITSSYREQSSQSRHTFGLAFDFNQDGAEGYDAADYRAKIGSDAGQLLSEARGNTISRRPTLLRPEYRAFFQIAATHGLSSLGLWKGTDYMHFQFASYPSQNWNYLDK